MNDILVRIQNLILMAPAFLLAITLHEAAHAWAANKLGDPTGRWAGRISLDPKVHFDPIGGLVFLITALAGTAFGWAKPVPVNPYNFRHPRRDMMLVSLAGPLTNLAQLALWAGLFHLSVKTLGHVDAGWVDVLLTLIFLGAVINAVLFLFNLVPIPPLDGSRVLAWVLPERDAQALDRLEPYGLMILCAVLILSSNLNLISPLVSWLISIFGLQWR